MSIIVIAIMVLTLWKAHFFTKGFNEAYISIEQTNSINGIFVIWVYLSHVQQYIRMDQCDILYRISNRILGQMIVVTFLFYSGYGIMLSIKNKYFAGLSY